MTKIWQWARKLKGSVMFNQPTPLWLNPKVQEMHQVQDTAGRGSKGLTLVHQLFCYGIFRTFPDLQQELNLLNHPFYLYLQIRHAIQAPIRTHPVREVDPSLLDKVAGETRQRGLISIHYLTLPEVVKSWMNVWAEQISLH